MAIDDKRILAEHAGLTFYVRGNSTIVFVETATGAKLLLRQSDTVPGDIGGSVGLSRSVDMSIRYDRDNEPIGFRITPNN